MAKYCLYWYPGTCARVPLVALEEIGQPFDLSLVDRTRPPDRSYLAVNPKGKVPALVADGRTITENPAIQLYLARRHPDACLIPFGDFDVEVDVLQTLSWFAAGVHPLLMRLRLPWLFCDQAAAFDSLRSSAREQLEDAFAILEARIQNRKWLYGEWSIVDAYMLWLWFRATGSGMDGSPFPRCMAHAAECEKRPSVAKALDREERELARLRAAGLLPANQPAFQGGRSRATRTGSEV
jgi:glutathione S-transferase